MNYYISDTHFGHANAIKFDSRPFKTVEEMDNTLIKNWNNVVKDDDTVYVVWDFSWYKEDKTLEILEKLNGHKVLIKGNHDKVSPKIGKTFEMVRDYLEINDGDKKVILFHYPIISWKMQFRGAVHLYGHVHNSNQNVICEKVTRELHNAHDMEINMFNIGCMMGYMGYTPRTLNEIIASVRNGGD